MEIWFPFESTNVMIRISGTRKQHIHQDLDFKFRHFMGAIRWHVWACVGSGMNEMVSVIHAVMAR